MKKILGSVLALLLFQSIAFSQDDDLIQDATFGVHFFFNDFKSAQAIRENSIGIVFKNREFGKIKDMSPGLALNYIQGITKYFDISATLSGSFLDYPMENQESFGKEFLLLEADFGIRGKMFPNNYVLQPYVQAGVGISKYKGYYGAILPIGVGMQVNIFNEAFLLINAQYRIPVTETTNYHFWFGVGLAGNIGKKKAE
jgi:OmpA-OmpF porin, OOP family